MGEHRCSAFALRSGIWHAWCTECGILTLGEPLPNENEAGRRCDAHRRTPERPFHGGLVLGIPGDRMVAWRGPFPRP
jgi:hypothetical protein